MSTFRCLVSALPLFVLAQTSYCDTFQVDPRGTYLTTSTTNTTNPVIVNLSSLSFPVHAGDVLQIERIGFFQFNASSGDNDPDMDGVFSSTNVLLGPTLANRVPGAIATNGVHLFIPQDFIIDNEAPGSAPLVTLMNIQVPVGANYLFIDAGDSVYTDNTDPNGDFAVSITATPEPGSLLLLAAGCSSLILRRRHARG